MQKDQHFVLVFSRIGFSSSFLSMSFMYLFLIILSKKVKMQGEKKMWQRMQQNTNLLLIVWKGTD